MLAELDGQFIRDFDFWLKTEKHCQNNSALKHLKNLKKVVRIALANDWIKKDPFYGIHFKQEEVNVEFLSREELDILMNKEFTIKRLEQVRDIFVFCCFTFVALTNVCLIINKLQTNNKGIGNGLETTYLHHFA